MQKVGEDDRGVLIQVYPPREDEREFVIPRDKLPREVGFVRDFIKIPTTLPQWSWIPAKLQGQAGTRQVAVGVGRVRQLRVDDGLRARQLLAGLVVIEHHYVHTQLTGPRDRLRVPDAAVDRHHQ